MDLELRRNVFHLLMGAAVAVIVWEIGRVPSMLMFSVALLIGITLSQYLEENDLPFFSFFIDRFEREGQRPGIGVLTFFVGSLLTVSIFPLKTAFIALLLVSFIDSFATIAGKAFGEIHIYNGKTLTGALAGYLAGLIVISPLAPLPHVLLTCLTGSIGELYLPYDNISVTILTAVAFTILTVLI